MSYESAKSEVDILVVTGYADQAERLSKRMLEYGLNISVEHCLSVPKALAQKLGGLHPRVVLYDHPDRTNDNDLMDSAKIIIDNARQPAMDTNLYVEGFKDLFGDAVVLVTSIQEQSSAQKSKKKTFLWYSPNSTCPEDSEVLNLAMLTDHNKTLIGIQDKIRPLLNHRLRRELLITALEANGTTEAKDLALKITGEPEDEAEKQVLSKACRLVRSCAVQFPNLFMGIVFFHGKFGGIPLFDAVNESHFNAVRMMLDEVDNDIVTEDKNGENLLSLAVSRVLESPHCDAARQIVRLLLEKGLDVRVVIEGWKERGRLSALQVADNRMDENLSNLLGEFGASDKE